MKASLELRPLDTPNVINTRNRVRLSAVANIFGCFLYLSIHPYFTQPEASWVHLVHILFDPLIIFVSIVDKTLFAYLAFIASAFMTFLDSGILLLNIVSVNRCIREPTASCFDRLSESSTWLLIALWFILFDVFQVMQLYDFHTQMDLKDSIEKANADGIKIDNKNPRYGNWLSVYIRKMRVLSLFLFSFDVSYVIALTTDSTELPLFWFGFVHVFIDTVVYFYVGTISNESERSTSFALVPMQIVRVMYILSLVSNVAVLWVLLASSDNTFGEYLALVIGMMYCITDAVQILYSSVWISIAVEYRQFQSSIKVN